MKMPGMGTGSEGQLPAWQHRVECREGNEGTAVCARNPQQYQQRTELALCLQCIVPGILGGIFGMKMFLHD